MISVANDIKQEKRGNNSPEIQEQNGPELGREAAAEALVYGWEQWDRISEMANPAGYLYRVGRSRDGRMKTACEERENQAGLSKRTTSDQQCDRNEPEATQEGHDRHRRRHRQDAFGADGEGGG